MGKLSALRKDILKHPEDYKDFVKSSYRGVSIYRHTTGYKIYISHYGRSYNRFVRKVLRDAKQI